MPNVVAVSQEAYSVFAGSWVKFQPTYRLARLTFVCGFPQILQVNTGMVNI